AGLVRGEVRVRRREGRDDQRLDVSRVRGALELRLPPGNASLRPVRARERDADLGRGDGTGGAGGPLCRVRVRRTGAKGRAAVPPERHREADRPLEDAGTRPGGALTRPLEPSPLLRRFGLLHATALNMTNMIGIGPFITIPLLMSALGGPQAMLGWVVALAIVACDGMVWSELGGALPGSARSWRPSWSSSPPPGTPTRRPPSTFRRAPSGSLWAFCWASERRRASASTTTSAITMSAISATKSRTPAGSSRGRSSSAPC